MIGEFDLIQRYFAACGQQGSAELLLGIGDDCALFEVPSGFALAQSLDTLVADVHFPASADPALIGWRALATNLSDLAAMGAQPHSFTLGISLPTPDESWVAGFCQGLGALADRAGIRLIGGDTTRGPLCISIQVQGLVPRGAALRRDRALSGDIICVSGCIGDAGAALPLVLAGQEPGTTDSVPDRYLLERYYNPQPRCELGQQLSAAGCRCGIDISDGLVADLGHILERSCVGAKLDLGAVPRSEAAKRRGQTLEQALSAGDDYELCICIAPKLWEQIQSSAWASTLVPIGQIVSAQGLFDLTGTPLVQGRLGYQHFESDDAE